MREVIGRAIAEERLVAHVAAAARTQWRAAAWLLDYESLLARAR